MAVSRTRLESAVLSHISKPKADARLGDGLDGLGKAITATFSPPEKPKPREIMAAVWSLVSRGSAFLDYSDPSPSNWVLVPSGEGRGTPSVDDGESFLDWLGTEVPVASPTVFHYASEALIAFNSRCHLSCVVAVSLASEAAFLDVAQGFTDALPDGHQQLFQQVLDNPATRITAKFVEFRKRLAPYQQELPAELADTLGLALESMSNLLQSYRNDAGHPVPLTVERDDAFVMLQLFARHLKKLYRLKTYFDATQLPNLGPPRK